MIARIVRLTVRVLLVYIILTLVVLCVFSCNACVIKLLK